MRKLTKKINVFFVLFFVLLISTACESDKAEKTKVILKDEIFAIEDIGFEELQVFIDTEQETLVYSRYQLTFRKTDEPSYLNIKVVEDRDWRTRDLLTRKYDKEYTVDVFINKNSIKDLSKKYANEFSETLIFED